MKRVISLLTMVAMMFSLLLVLPQKIIYAAYPIEVAVTWAIDIANDSSHGYSQNNRWGPDYDCSSFVMSAYIQAGIPLNRSNSTTRENSAYWMVPEYEKNNFTYIPWSSIGNQNSLIRGDILWRNGHTELYIGDGKNVGAHQDEYGGIEGANKGDQTGNEISITNFDNSGSWTGVLRYNGVVPPVICNCTDNYAGIYTTKNVNTTLNIRSGHGSGYSVIGSIPAGAYVKVTKSDGAWAHVEYNGVSGFASMDYLTKKSLPSVYMKISGETVPPDNQPYGKFFGIYGTITAYPDIEAVWGGIRKQGQTEYVQYVQDFPYASSYDLHGIFNDQLIFNTLAEDYYTYVVYGRDVEKREYKLIEKNFTVGNPPCITHSFGEWTVKTAATCTTDGSKTRTCSICGYSESASITKTGHNYVETTVAATCTTDGKTEKKCTNCGDTITSVIKSTGHKYGEWTISKNSTCIEDGTQVRTCSVCQHTEAKEIAKSGHKYTETVIKPSCTEKGYTIYECSVCRDTYKDNYTDMTNHTYKSATIDGKNGFKCETCGSISIIPFEGSGTEENPYKISSKEDLFALSSLVNDMKTNDLYGHAYYIQTADIDLEHELFEPI